MKKIYKKTTNRVEFFTINDDDEDDDGKELIYL